VDQLGRESVSTPVFITARLNNKAQPIDRGELFENPLAEVLAKIGSADVTGGGTQLTSEREVDFCDVEISASSVSDELLSRIAQTLEQCGAGKGSKLMVQGREIKFGSLEGLGLYLNGTDLPPEVYQSSDVNYVYEEINRLVSGLGAIQTHWQGPRETALYVYGSSFEEMRSRLTPLLESYPLCQKARVVQVA
jgi:hypothetical protein